MEGLLTLDFSLQEQKSGGKGEIIKSPSPGETLKDFGYLSLMLLSQPWVLVLCALQHTSEAQSTQDSPCKNAGPLSVPH